MVDIATKRKILIEYGAGASIVALSKKYAVSRKTISKILSEKKVPKKFPSKKKVPIEDDRIEEASEALDELEEESNKELAEKTVRAIMKSLPKDIAEASLKDKMRVLEQMTAIFGIGDDDEAKKDDDSNNVHVVFEFKDTAIKNNGDK